MKILRNKYSLITVL